MMITEQIALNIIIRRYMKKQPLADLLHDLEQEMTSHNALLRIRRGHISVISEYLLTRL
jgi:hypothetical protein